MTALSTDGVPHTFAIGRNHFFTVFGKLTKVESKAGSHLGESSATLGHTPLPDATEIIREGNAKSLERKAFYQRNFVLILSTHPTPPCDGERIWEEIPRKINLPSLSLEQRKLFVVFLFFSSFRLGIPI